MGSKIIKPVTSMVTIVTKPITSMGSIFTKANHRCGTSVQFTSRLVWHQNIQCIMKPVRRLVTLVCGVWRPLPVTRTVCVVNFKWKSTEEVASSPENNKHNCKHNDAEAQRVAEEPGETQGKM